MERIADTHARRAMNVPVTEPTPPASGTFGYILLCDLTLGSMYPSIYGMATSASNARVFP
jgi:hypothetical protein